MTTEQDTKMDLRTREKIVEALYYAGTPLSCLGIKESVEKLLAREIAENKIPAYHWHEYYYFLEYLVCRGYATHAGKDKSGHTLYVELDYEEYWDELIK